MLPLLFPILVLPFVYYKLPGIVKTFRYPITLQDDGTRYLINKNDWV